MTNTHKASVAVEFDQVVKAFGPVQVLHGVSFALAPGRVYGLLGENGAGKSTLMKILSGIHTRDSGTVEIFGKAYDDLRPPSPPTTPPPVRLPVRPCWMP